MLYQRGKAYSQDLRERVFAASDDGERVGEIADLLRVSVAYVSKALTRRRTTGETTARQQHGHQEHQRHSRVIDVQPEIDCRDHADGGDHEEITFGLRSSPGFHTRIVRWT